MKDTRTKRLHKKPRDDFDPFTGPSVRPGPLTKLESQVLESLKAGGPMRLRELNFEMFVPENEIKEACWELIARRKVGLMTTGQLRAIG